MEANGHKPYSEKSPLVQRTKLTRGFVGDIALGKKMCSPDTLLQLQKASNGEFRAASMMEWWSTANGSNESYGADAHTKAAEC
tara:strand:- start:1144 stop:1392 length:249 start_codon:yes stop_codon:yes gene_type:complete